MLAFGQRFGYMSRGYPVGRPALANRSRVGQCFSGSSAINRDDAWRCISGSVLHDPCLSDPTAARVVLCPGSQLRFAIKLHLTKALPRKFGNPGRLSPHALPWNLQLIDGEYCQVATSATTVVHGKRLNDICDRHQKIGLWGPGPAPGAVVDLGRTVSRDKLASPPVYPSRLDVDPSAPRCNGLWSANDSRSTKHVGTGAALTVGPVAPKEQTFGAQGNLPNVVGLLPSSPDRSIPRGHIREEPGCPQ
jgi:hypothetical protein